MFRSNIILSHLTVLLSVPTLLTAHASDAIPEDWSVDLGFSILGSPLVRDLDGDGYYEILVSSSGNGKVYVLDHHGQPLDGWPVQIVVDEPRDMEWKQRTYETTTYPNLQVSPSIGDIDGDGELDIVVADANRLSYVDKDKKPQNPGATYSYLHAWELDGRPKKFTGIDDYRVLLDGSIKSVPRLIDVDGDGSDELLLHTGASKLYLLNGDGTVRGGWPADFGGDTDDFGNWSIGSSPIALDLDFDGKIEVAVATTGGEVRVYDVDGEAVSGWPVSTDVVDQGDGFHLSSLAAVDLNDDYQLELVLGGADGKVYAWHADGTPVSGFPTDAVGASIRASVAAANLLSGIGYVGETEVDFAGPELVVVDTAYHVSCFSSRGVRIWSQAAAGSASPIIVDGNNDGDLEVVVPYLRYVHVVEADGTEINALSLESLDTIGSSPVCVDLDSDDDLELLYGCMDSKLYCVQLVTSDDHASNSIALGWNAFLGDRGDSANGPMGDLDSDKIADDYERDYFGHTEHAADDDFDQDGSSNYVEWGAGTDPTDSSDQLRINSITFDPYDGEEYDHLGKSAVFLNWDHKSGHRYDIFSKERLDGDWVLEEANLVRSLDSLGVPIKSEASQCFYSITAKRAF